jgi:hypothetical protein
MSASRTAASTACLTAAVLFLLGGTAARGEPAEPKTPPLYDPKTVETASGTVVAIARTAQGTTRGFGVRVSLKTDAETIPVHLAPAWFLKNEGFEVKENDRLEVRGSRVSLAGTPAIIAAEAKNGTKTVKLRDDKGVPVWGWRRGT